MQTILDLWNGNIAPVEHCGAHDAQANELLGLMARNHEALCDGLTAAQKETFEKYVDCAEEYLFRMMELAFGEGFCLGSRLLVDTFRNA